MKTGYGFTEFENIKEFEEWLNKQKVSRVINKLQVHHMYAPSYANWDTDNALRRQNNIKSFHKNTNGWADIAQHFSIFPDGHIVTGRSLNSTPIGIKGWNVNAICIEIYGNFDKGQDNINKEQKEAVIACYALLAKKFNIQINSNYIRPHAWFTAGGTYLGDYNKSKSAKTCPGSNFMGYGNTKAAFEKFYNDIKNYRKTSNSAAHTPSNVWKNGDYNCKVRATANLNLRTGRGTDHKVITTTPKGTVFTIGYIHNNWGSTWDFKGQVGYFCCDYIERV